MKLSLIPMLGAALVALPTLAEVGTLVPRGPQIVKVTFRDGTVRTGTLRGVGCPIAICSRVAFKGVHQDDSVVREQFEDLAAIRDVTSHAASFVGKDGSSKRLTFLYDFRVLYLEESGNAERKVDFVEVKSVEFTGAAR